MTTTRQPALKTLDFSLPLLNNQHEVYAQGIFQGLSQTDSALEAKYAPTWVRTYAHHLSINVYIKGRIAHLFKAKADGLVDASIMDVKERKQRLSEIGRGRLGDVVDCEGQVLEGSLRSGALQEIRRVSQSLGPGKGVSVSTTVKLRDPMAAISELNKMEQVYSEAPQYNDNRNQTIVVVDKETRDLLEQIGNRTRAELPAAEVKELEDSKSED